MNAKLAKQLRRAVRIQVADLPERRPAMYREGPKRGQHVNHPASKRAVFRQVKRQVTAARKNA